MTNNSPKHQGSNHSYSQSAFRYPTLLSFNRYEGLRSLPELGYFCFHTRRSGKMAASSRAKSHCSKGRDTTRVLHLLLSPFCSRGLPAPRRAAHSSPLSSGQSSASAQPKLLAQLPAGHTPQQTRLMEKRALI